MVGLGGGGFRAKSPKGKNQNRALFMMQWSCIAFVGGTVVQPKSMQLHETVQNNFLCARTRFCSCSVQSDCFPQLRTESVKLENLSELTPKISRRNIRDN